MSADAKFRALSKRAAECQRQIARLSVVDSIRLREETASQIRDNLREIEQDIKAVQQIADLEDEETTRKAILSKLKEYDTQFQQLQSSSRTSLWGSKRRLDMQEQQMRMELFGRQRDGDNDYEQYELKSRRNRGQDESLLRAHTDVTDALRRTATQLQQELEKSSISTDILADSSRSLHLTYTEYQNFGSLLTISKRLVGQLETADWIDRLSLLFGLLVFITVVLYIIKKRTYDVGISWVSFIIGKHEKAATIAVSKTADAFTTTTMSGAINSITNTAPVEVSSLPASASIDTIETIVTQAIKVEL
ncbi:Sec20-domain-containing protein [Dichotomocladium elegans]|nr:Sec20-domain-containing protein [Dichotomocladium elegans]